MSAPVKPTSNHYYLEQLIDPEPRSILCYPQGDEAEARRRIQELESLGLSHLILEGPVRLGKTSVLGKGCVSLVVKAVGGGGCIYALKIRRLDANRPSLEEEARLLALANQVNVGPRLVKGTRNFLLMELAEGEPFHEYLLREERPRQLLASVKALLDQCRALDRIGLSHGELSTLKKHVQLAPGPRPVILDFETASLRRTSSNVTAAAQYIFLGGPPGRRIQQLLTNFNTEALLSALRDYKKNRTDEAYERLTATLDGWLTPLRD